MRNTHAEIEPRFYFCECPNRRLQFVSQTYFCIILQASVLYRNQLKPVPNWHSIARNTQQSKISLKANATKIAVIPINIAGDNVSRKLSEIMVGSMAMQNRQTIFITAIGRIYKNHQSKQSSNRKKTPCSFE